MTRRWRGPRGYLAAATAAGAIVAVAGGATVLALTRRDPYAPRISPVAFTTRIDNPFFPLAPGTRWVYERKSDAGPVDLKIVEVTGETRDVMGVTCVVVRETRTENWQVAEHTLEWYAQDSEGNVWYFGEETSAYRDGRVVSTRGSWEAGVDGAQPGIAMLAVAEVGQRYRQEQGRGFAEMAKVLSRDVRASVPYGSYDQLLVTEDYTSTEPMSGGRTYFARGVGVVLEVTVEDGRETRFELVRLSRPASGVIGRAGYGDRPR
jgi:hypothetical protein